MVEGIPGSGIGLAKEAVKNAGKGVGTVIAETARDGREWLASICMPASRQLGLLFEDELQAWRAENLGQTLARAKRLHDANNVPEGSTAPPRLICKIADNASWTDDAVLQDLWAGLMASSCSEDGGDDSNLVFVNVVEKLTSLQAKIIEHVTSNSTIRFSQGHIFSDEVHGVATVPVPVSFIGEPESEAILRRFQREIQELDIANILHMCELYPSIPS